MKRVFFFSALSLLILSLLASPVMITAPAFAKSNKDSPNPVQRLKKQTDELLDGLDEKGLKFIYATRMRDGAIRATHYIKGMVSGATEACGEAQPDMKNDIENRYEKWWAAIKPLLDEAEKHMDETIKSQDVIEQKKIYDHLALVREAALYTRSKVEKEFVTDREACQYLLDNMDKTEANLKKQLKDTLASIEIPSMEEQTKTQDSGEEKNISEEEE
jgi:hypothetical protein